MVSPTVVSRQEDLQQILLLQQKNLKDSVHKDEWVREGFVTMKFDLQMLEQLHRLAPSIIIKSQEKLIAYAIVVLLEGRANYPAIEPLFAHFSHMQWKGRDLNNYRFYIMGQICIDQAWRGRGLFKMLYHHHRNLYNDKYELVITEISSANLRSLNAHFRIGFETLHVYRDAIDEWVVVAWDWYDPAN